ncbi:hypothetical protein TanjilG_24642 [Lupinus angustifolius]|uniref:Autophagy-related protein 18a n=1 Tax=Lupinus angustifolius TaxID=3871 RepID=A0A4P1RKA9_LUPAN|nr:PREDICTED: autophagy-related protein 18a-like [Lupinus angustifolius]OIW12709.1 hypothetical protein TanjilG_24642 [Lupinus angustifolius]
MSLTPRDPLSLLHLSFNQDHSCFSATTFYGFHVYNTNPFHQLFRRKFPPSALSSAEMLNQSNIIALVGSGSHPHFPINKVMLWDDQQGKCIGELSFRSTVRAVKLRRDRVIVVLEMKVFVYNLADFKFLLKMETVANPKGLCAVSQASDSIVIACPGLHRGQVRLDHCALKKTSFMTAHDSGIACLALTLDGKFLATASTKGTLIRVFHTANATLLQEVRRGSNAAQIYSLTFDCNAQWLAVSSDKGTVHVFGLKVNSAILEHENSGNSSNSDAGSTLSRASLSFTKFKGVLPKYLKSEWSVAQFHLHEASRYIVAFGHQKNTVIIIGLNGSFYRCEFDPMHGGEMTQLEHHNLLKSEVASEKMLDESLH